MSKKGSKDKYNKTLLSNINTASTKELLTDFNSKPNQTYFLMIGILSRANFIFCIFYI